MSDVDAFAALAEKLPPDLRSRFLAMSIQLKNLPPDDELSIALEALGFTTLVLQDIPREISKAISEAKSGLSDSQRDGLRDDIEAILVRSLDTPSYKDLRETIRQMKDHHHRIQRETGNLAKSLSKTRIWLERRSAVLPSLALGLVAGIIAGGIVAGAMLLNRPVDDTAVSKNESVLPPDVEKRLDYFEIELSEYGGNVGIMNHDDRRGSPLGVHGG